MAATAPAPTSEGIEAGMRRGLGRRVRDIWNHRALIRHLARRELRVRYKGSALGMLWSLMNPLLYMFVFNLVFTELLRSRVPDFGLFLLAGLLAWQLFATSVISGSNSLLENRSLVQKIWFPREVLPLAVVAAGLVDMIFKLSVLAAGLVIFGRVPDFSALPLLFAAVITLLVVSAGLALIAAPLTVSYRDVKHFIDVGLAAWFWMSAIVYPYALVSERLGDREILASLNPVIPVIVSIQRVAYNPDPATDGVTVLPVLDQSWFYQRLGLAFIIGVVLIVIGLLTFARHEADFGEKL